ncbi:MAG: hypothetical protein IT577_13350 [Verrucomicrobiae bacterium]|nr:hypothetical protein [Verrucomicrobiae bacterium]
MRRELLFLAAGVAALALTAQVVNWRGVSVNTATGIANVTNIGFRGQVTASNFVGDGSALTGIASPETNWWAVFSIPNDDPNWFDFTLKASTNAFRSDWPGGNSTKVFIYTSVEPRLNGTPSWETFATNWYPRTYFYFDHDYNTHSVWNPNPVDPTGTASIEDKFDAEPGVLNPPVVRWVVMVHCTAIVHPTNRLSWAYLRQNKVSNEVTAVEGRAYWRSIDPAWVTYDPRYRFTPHPWYPNLTNQHQQP